MCSQRCCIDPVILLNETAREHKEMGSIETVSFYYFKLNVRLTAKLVLDPRELKAVVVSDWFLWMSEGFLLGVLNRTTGGERL